MKNYIKKIIIGMFSLTLFLGAVTTVSASSVWNGASNDCPDINIANYTTNTGYGSPCWSGTNISANPGDVINVKVYYHNTSSATATNVHLKLFADTSSSKNHSFSAQILSDQGNLYTGNVSVNISSSQSLSLLSTKWYPNQSLSNSSLLNGQSSSDVTSSSGLYIGSIAPGWTTQGSINVSFKVSEVTQPETCKDPSATNYGEPLPCTYPQQTMSGNLSASSQSCIIASGNSTCSIPFYWSTQNPKGTSSVTHNYSTVGTGNNGGKTFAIEEGSQTYYLYNSGQLLDTETVTASCASNSSWNGSYCAPVVVNNCKINNFYASNYSITKGNSSKLYWNTENCTSATISNIGTVNTSGSQDVWPTNTTTYTLNAYGNGDSKVSSVTIYVDEDNNDSCTIDSFTATDTHIDEGDSTRLKWNTTGCNTVKISEGVGYVDDDGSETVYPDEDTTYTITAYNNNGYTRTKDLKIYVEENDNNDSCTIDSFTASDTSIDRGDSTKLRWNTTGCDEISLSGVGYVDDDGSETVYPYSTTTYTLNAYGDRTRSKSLTVRVNNYSSIIPHITTTQIYNTNVVTLIATNISQTGAQLNGILTSSDFGSQNSYFEYGTTVDLGMQTQPKTVSSNSNFNSYISGLNPDTVYYFQAVSEGQNNISRGAIEVFKTSKYITPTVSTNKVTTTRVIKREVVEGNTVYGSTSPLILEISNKYKNISKGDTIDYTIYYKNISSSILTNPMIQVHIPEGIVVTNLSGGIYSQEDKTVSIQINNLNPGDEGRIYIQAKVNSIDPTLAQVVTTALLIYTNPNNAQENAMAYVLNNPTSLASSALGASAFLSGMFGGSTLIGWLVFIIIVLLIIIITRLFYGKRTVQKK